ncbi:Ger(x)C family spore germination protein [Paenibacillus tyrfis]|uniref:Ger(x)C family spore germination protein n=1 Tax=Paenibacillus tyrfis TaxID=1501230 RepID=UPI0020A04ADD|nr:Ger(x)C family spore germination protein [Paenibacillus tyrfis]MCP1307505.1 Ger(x)C family spore germination protein [Paenibacillus tyrfis]
MKRWVRTAALALCVAVLPGCWDQTNIENLTLALTIGLDLDEKDNLMVYMASPVFTKEAKKKNEVYGFRSKTIRTSRNKFDSVVTALTVGGKSQALLLGKRLVERADWFPLTDVFFRDGKQTVNAKVVFVDGLVRDVIHHYPRDKPRLSFHLSRLLDKNNRRNFTVRTTLQKLLDQKYEKGMTISISELKLNKELEVTGTALLDNKGKYKGSLNQQESAMLLILQRRTVDEVPFNIHVPHEQKSGVFASDIVSFNAGTEKVKIKTAYNEGKFRFDVAIHLSGALTQRLFPFDFAKKGGELEAAIEKQLEKQFSDVLKKFQSQKVDPVGFGIYARAHHYKEYKQVQQQWPEVFAKADVNVKVKLTLKSSGATK